MTLDAWTALTPDPEPLAEGKEWHAFLSYRSVNRPWVLNLYDVLRERGYKVYLDQVVLAGGNELISKLSGALRKSQAGVLIWSSAAADSAWVEKEYATMDLMATNDPSFHFVPVRLDDTELPGFAGLRVFMDFSQYPDGPNGGELLRLLHAIVGRPLSEEAARFASEQDVAAKEDTAKIDAAIELGNGDRLIELFEEGGLSWETTAVLGCRAAEGLTRLDRDDDAIRMLETVGERFPVAIRPKQLRALALARRGDPGDLEQAQDIMGTLKAAKHEDPETLGIYARTWMDRYAATRDILDLKKSRNLYEQAFEGAGDDYYTGINAAAKNAFIGTPDALERARELATKVEEIVGTETKPGDYWMTATVGEVQLLQGRYEEAAARYADAVEMASEEFGSHKTTWKQACRLMHALGATDEQRALVRAAFEHLDDCDALLGGEPS